MSRFGYEKVRSRREHIRQLPTWLSAGRQAIPKEAAGKVRTHKLLDSHHDPEVLIFGSLWRGAQQ